MLPVNVQFSNNAGWKTLAGSPDGLFTSPVNHTAPPTPARREEAAALTPGRGASTQQEDGADSSRAERRGADGTVLVAIVAARCSGCALLDSVMRTGKFKINYSVAAQRRPERGAHQRARAPPLSAELLMNTESWKAMLVLPSWAASACARTDRQQATH